MKKLITVLSIAAICHALNKAYCEGLGDTTQPSWEDAPQWQKDSAVNGVSFHLAYPDAPASASHENWMNEKLADGWKYGQVKDPAKKEHPCLVPFNELPATQQAKDFIFKQTVHELAPYISEEGEKKETEVEKTAFETNLKIGDDVMVKSGGPKMKVDVVFNTPLGVKAHCTWPVGNRQTSDVFFEHTLYKFDPAQEEATEAKANEGPSLPSDEKVKA
jgi:uncharacterized protein YodC (DUF2158 family)